MANFYIIIDLHVLSNNTFVSDFVFRISLHAVHLAHILSDIRLYIVLYNSPFIFSTCSKATPVACTTNSTDCPIVSKFLTNS